MFHMVTEEEMYEIVTNIVNKTDACANLLYENHRRNLSKAIVEELNKTNDVDTLEIAKILGFKYEGVECR